jgi:squalene synthase HpnC
MSGAEDPIEGENFPVAMRVLPRDVRADLTAVYRFARYVDNVGDESSGDRLRSLEAVATDLQRLYDGRAAEIAEVEGLRTVVNRCDVPIDPWLALVEANVMDQRRTRYDSFEDLLGYCELSANPVGRVVLHVFGQATPERIALSDRVCTALQLIEHWQDLREDYLQDRVYVPQEDLRRFGVAEADLDRAKATPALAALVRFETDRALAWLDAGALLVGTLRGWARVAVSGYVNGGRAAAWQLRKCGHDPLGGVPKPTSAQVAATWARSCLRSAG